MSVKIQNESKLSPRLRMVLNGNATVNALRSEQDPALAVVEERTLASVPSLLAGEIPRLSDQQLAKLPERQKLKRIPPQIHTSILIRLKDEKVPLPDVLREEKIEGPAVRRGDLVSATVPLDSLPSLLKDPLVVAVESPGSLAFLPPIKSSLAESESQNPPTPAERWSNLPGSAASILPPGTGPVLVGIIDVQGFDFAHSDFMDADGRTRFEAIWDQAGTSHPSPPRFGYGAELTGRMLNRAIRSQERWRLPAVQLEPQSEMVAGSHGTHVASIAAGNHGLCPQARIAAVLLSLGQQDTDRRLSFYDSSRLVHAVDYLFQLGRKLKMPVSINISLGTNSHSHDGTSLISRWLDFELTTPGRAVCVAAGNAGQEGSVSPGDIGYVMGRIHTSGRLKEGKSSEISWEVIGNGITDISENKLEIWYSECDHFSVQVKPPFGEWSPVVRPGEYLENVFLANKTVLSIYNEWYVPMNGLNYIACYLSPYFSREAVVGIQSGTWQVRLIPDSVRDGSYHAWIERDDPFRYASQGDQRQVWAFPSYFTEMSNVDDTSVSSLACGHSIISVANYDPRKKKIHPTSSQGPTRDGRAKPDVAAPGTDIIAACGFNPDPQAMWLAMTGTSMASPYVCGVVAAMLSADPGLTATQINGILHHTARPLKTGTTLWENQAGFGLIGGQACLEEVAHLRNRKDLKP